MTSIMEAITALENLLSPFLTDLSPEERKRLSTLGSHYLGFYAEAREVRNTFPDIYPGNFDMDEFDKDARFWQQIAAIRPRLNRLMEGFGDTRTAVSHDLFSASLSTYTFAKTSGFGEAIDGYVQRMGSYFDRSSPSTPPSQ